MIAIPATVRVSPARVFAAHQIGAKSTKTRNLFPFCYDTDRDQIAAKIAKLSDALELERANLHRAMRRDGYSVASFRRSVARIENYIRNGRERLARLGA